jgi:hypothetical protein
MFQLKKLSREAVPAALEKAERYRLLNEPWQAESICRDVLTAEPENQRARIILLLALTDQFGRRRSANVKMAREALDGLAGEYERAYYAGVISERWAKAQLKEHTMAHVAYDWLVEAMEWYEKARAIHPPGAEDAVLRWNACVRLIERHGLRPRDGEGGLPTDSDHDVPLR